MHLKFYFWTIRGKELICSVIGASPRKLLKSLYLWSQLTVSERVSYILMLMLNYYQYSLWHVVKTTPNVALYSLHPFSHSVAPGQHTICSQISKEWHYNIATCWQVIRRGKCYASPRSRLLFNQYLNSNVWLHARIFEPMFKPYN